MTTPQKLKKARVKPYRSWKFGPIDPAEVGAVCAPTRRRKGPKVIDLAKRRSPRLFGGGT